jgi:hypothetical protein
MKICLMSILTLALSLSFAVSAEDPPAQPRSVPLTRPAMKQALEDLKDASPRVPPPELTKEEKAKLGDRADTPEARIRARYLPPHVTPADNAPDPDPTITNTNV